MKQSTTVKFTPKTTLGRVNMRSWRWADMTDTEELASLKTMLEETDDDARTLSDERLAMLLEEAGGDLRRAAYNGAILKARNTALRLPDGVTMESQREYWLTVARTYRGSATTLAERS